MNIVRDNYYIICLDFKFHQLYIIWITDDVDEVMVNENLKVIAFKSKIALLQYWQMHIKEPDTEITIYDAYNLHQWLLKPVVKFNYDTFLNLWNLFTDVAFSIKSPFLGDVKDTATNLIYDKVFNASDVFIADEPNPVFSSIEIGRLKSIMQDGLDMLLNNLFIQE